MFWHASKPFQSLQVDEDGGDDEGEADEHDVVGVEVARLEGRVVLAVVDLPRFNLSARGKRNFSSFTLVDGCRS